MVFFKWLVVTKIVTKVVEKQAKNSGVISLTH